MTNFLQEPLIFLKRNVESWLPKVEEVWKHMQEVYMKFSGEEEVEEHMEEVNGK